VKLSNTDALIVADVQLDFCPGGALGVKGGDEIVPVLNAMTPKFEHIVLTRDWHPPGHCSFVDEPRFVDRSWPVHCVAHTHGAQFHPDFEIPDHAFIISKGTDLNKEAYSGFSVPELREQLNQWEVRRVFVCGLATDYCVKNTAMDAVKAGFQTYVVLDASRGVDVPAGSVQNAIDDMKRAGIKTCQSGELE
jgi:nicotinamidase/pyrazinamidase